MPLHILALETSTAICSVALLRHDQNGDQLWSNQYEGATGHSEHLLPMVDYVLAQANIQRRDLTAVAFGQGPGAFTGLRVACGVAQGLGFALAIPLLPVVSHAAVAACLPHEVPSLRVIALDARMDEAYIAVYRHAKVVQHPQLIPQAQIAPWVAHHAPAWLAAEPYADAPQLVFAGDLGGFAANSHDDSHALHRGWPPFFTPVPNNAQLQPASVSWWGRLVRPHATVVARLGLQAYKNGKTVAPADALPLYVRDKVAFTSAERATGTVGGNPRAGGWQ